MDCTVIIPTLEMALPATDLIVQELVHNSENVKKIIFINNRKEPTLAARYSDFSKIVFLDNLPNLIVNPAWNYGMNLVETKYYILLNDDLIVSGKLIDEIIKLHESNDSFNLTTINTHRIFGMTPDNLANAKKEFSQSKLSIPLKYKKVHYPDYRQGWFMLGKTAEWTPIYIPACGVLMNGDDWIYQRNLEKFGAAIFIENNYLWHFESTSSNHVSHGRNDVIESVAKPLELDHELIVRNYGNIFLGK